MSSRLRSLGSTLLAVGVPLLATAGVLYGVVVVGRYASGRLGKRECVDIASVQCVPPEGLTREEFLAQVQYLAGLPDTLDAGAGPIPAQLVAAFSRHPWVEQVVRVTIRPTPRVELSYRTPVLAVKQDGEKRAVDGHGVLLPETKHIDRLPVLTGTHKRPAGPPGTEWGDERVEEAARTVAFLAEACERFGVTAIESSSEGLVLRTAKAHIVWGRPPGAEDDDEAPAKRKRLMERETITGRVDMRAKD